MRAQLVRKSLLRINPGPKTPLAGHGSSYLVDFHPALLAGPGEHAFGCKPSLEIRRSCPTLGPDCALEPPPGYWRWGRNSSVACGDKCAREAMEEVNRRAVPACLCTCSDEYKKLEAIDANLHSGSPPP